MRQAGPITVVCLIVLAGCGKSGGTSEAALADQSAAAAKAPTSAATKALLATLPPAYQAADLDNGEAKFALCPLLPHDHQRRRQHDRAEPLGRVRPEGGEYGGFQLLRRAESDGYCLGRPAIDRWITNPRAVVPSTKMTYLGMESPTDRRDVIAYLKVATGAPAS